MHVVTKYPDGVFNWIDLTTTDVAGAKAFYGGLFGWEGDDMPTGGGPDYTMFKIDGHAVAGATPMSADMEQMGVPPVWVSYVKYDDIDGAAARAAEAGGQVFMPPMDVLDSGRMTLIQDPTGAAFGIWSPRAFEGAALVNQPNTLAWNELQTRDLPAARVRELGGTVLVGPNSAGEMGRFIVVRDPQGAVFTAMQFNGPMDLPPGVEEN